MLGLQVSAALALASDP